MAHLKWIFRSNLLFLFFILTCSSYSQEKSHTEILIGNSISSLQPVRLTDSTLAIIYIQKHYKGDTVYFAKSDDNGLSFTYPEVIAVLSKETGNEEHVLSAALGNNGNILINTTQVSQYGSPRPVDLYSSNDNGGSWTYSAYYATQNSGSVKLKKIKDNVIFSMGHKQAVWISRDNGQSWKAQKTTGFFLEDAVLTGADTILSFSSGEPFSSEKSAAICSRISTDEGITWTSPDTIITESFPFERLSAVRSSSGVLTVYYQISEQSGNSQLLFRKSTDNGKSWGNREYLTSYTGSDFGLNVTDDGSAKPIFTYLSSRSGANKVYSGITGSTFDINPPPVLYSYKSDVPEVNTPVTIKAYLGDEKGILSAHIDLKINNEIQTPISMYDDGLHQDSLAGDNIFTAAIGPFEMGQCISYGFRISDVDDNVVITKGESTCIEPELRAENWLKSGSLHNLYSSLGSEPESMDELQKGLRWPAINKDQDMQVSKALWIGVKDFQDESGETGSTSFFEHKVVHVGPRVSGEGEFIPRKFLTISKYPPTQVSVNGVLQKDTSAQIDSVDQGLKADRMIYNEVNTQIGLTMARRIMQWSQEYHDNYHLIEYVFKNTGNIDDDPDIELPAKTLNDVYFYFLNRYAICKNTRYAIGNATGWGMNTMIDTRGDGITDSDNPDNIRCQFAWHGPFPPYSFADNLGGPLLSNYLNDQDTIGRLGAAQFTGVVTIHADKSAGDKTNDPTQPSTTSFEGSDESLTSGNTSFDMKKMEMEYEWMSKGHISPRHALLVDPDGNFATTRNVDPSMRTPGGFSMANGYGPYTLAPGDSIVLVIAEAAAGLSKEKSLEYGAEYKSELIAANHDITKEDAASYKKNLRVLTGKDSLFQSFGRAISNYTSGYKIAEPPAPPAAFRVEANENTITLSWKVNNEENLSGFEIWRAAKSYDSIYIKVFETNDIVTRSFIDSTVKPGIEYFYFLLNTGNEIPADPALGIWSKKLTSSRYYTQTYQPVFVLATDVKSTGKELSYELQQNYPNPFNPSTKIKWQIAKAGMASIKIYDILGREVMTLVNEFIHAGSHETEFNAQALSSGIYIYQLKAGNFVETKKMILLR